jgi:hypothetical protein
MLENCPTKVNKIPLHLKMVFLFSKYKFDNEQVIKEEFLKNPWRAIWRKRSKVVFSIWGSKYES